MTPHDAIDVRPPAELGPVYELLRYSMPVPVRGSGLGRGPVPHSGALTLHTFDYLV